MYEEFFSAVGKLLDAFIPIAEFVTGLNEAQLGEFIGELMMGSVKTC